MQDEGMGVSKRRDKWTVPAGVKVNDWTAKTRRQRRVCVKKPAVLSRALGGVCVSVHDYKHAYWSVFEGLRYAIRVTTARQQPKEWDRQSNTEDTQTNNNNNNKRLCVSVVAGAFQEWGNTDITDINGKPCILFQTILAMLLLKYC